MQNQLALDAVVTVVDALHIWSHWEVVKPEQIAFADVILLNKTDLVSESVLEGLERRIRECAAKIYHTM